MEPFDYCAPKTWPLRWRRAFLFTLPVSGPLWIASLVVGGALTLVLCVIMIPFTVLKENLWDHRPDEIAPR